MTTPHIAAEKSKTLDIQPTEELVNSNLRSYDVVLTLFTPLTAKPAIQK